VAVGVTHPCPSCEAPVPNEALFCPGCGASAAAPILDETLLGAGLAGAGTPSYELAPERLRAALGPNYELGRLLGRGGYAEVFTVRDLRLGRELAVKVLRPDLILSEQLVGRFRREALAVGAVQNAHIVPVYDVGESDGVLWILMPLIQGETLKSILAREGRLPVSEVRRILLEAASALHAAHRAGVIHRDIKPENLMIEGSTGRVMLMDFGIAKAIDAGGDHSLTGTGVIVGTPKYMSPEQAMGKQAVGAATDQYSLAVVGYQMLSGRVPFEGDNVREVMARQLFDEPVPLSRMLPDIPPEVSSTIHRALRKDPARRFASIDDFSRGLKGEQLATPEGERKRRSAPPAVPRSGRGWVALAAGIVVLGGGIYGAARAGMFRERPADSAPAPAPAPLPAPGTGPDRSVGSPARRSSGAAPRPLTRDTTAPSESAADAATTCADAMRLEEWATAFTRCSAEAGASSAARRNLGILYAEGKGVPRDDRLASVHLGLAAQDQDLPDTTAVVLMAERYDRGLGVPGGPDRNKGAGLWEVAAAMGVEQAWPIIAERYALGDGRRKNEATAVRWYEKAAEAGNVPSMLRLAELLDRGQGVRKDEAAAGRWYARAAEQRDAEGEYQLAIRLLTGRAGFVRDESTGIQWLRRAAEHGHTEAKRELARRGG
jgi:serine/threonine protein kinase/TPR repeat protein